MIVEDNPIIPRIYWRSAEVESRLNDRDIDLDILRDAVRFGWSFAADCTAHDPPATKGIIAWAKINRALRDRLIPQGWSVENKQNYAVTVHPTGEWAIAVAAGDSRTGRPDLTPATSTAKGPATQHVVLVNQLTFATITSDWKRLSPTTQTWILLHHSAESDDYIGAELSLPAVMDSDGRVVEWQERIIFWWSDGGAHGVTNAPEDDGGMSDPVDVPVEAKLT